MTVVLTDDTFDKEVLESELPVLVDFFAPWCGPCNQMIPVVDKLAEEMDGKAKVCKINVNEHTVKAGEYKVMSIPSFKVFKDGELVDQWTGGSTLQQLKDKLK